MKKTPVSRCLFHKKNRIATGREGGAALREQSDFAANYCISSKVERNQTIDNRLAGRAAKGESPVASTNYEKDTCFKVSFS